MWWNELTFAEYVIKRFSSRWYCGLLLAGCGLMVIIAGIQGPEMEKQLLDNRANIFTAMTFLTLLIVIAVSATEIPGDIISKVIYIILSKPVERHQIVVGKFLGVLGLGTMTTAALWIVSAGALWFFGLAPDAVMFQQGGFLLCRIMLVSAMAILFSTFLSETPTIAFSVAYLISAYFTHYVKILLVTGKIGGTIGAKIVFTLLYYMAPNMRFLDAPSTSDVAVAGNMQQLVDNAELAQGLLSGLAEWPHFFLAIVYSIFYAGLLIMVAIRFFQTRRVA